MSTVSIPNDCPFCLDNNLLKGPILAQTDSAFLVNAHSNPGNFLIIPTVHVENPQDLPDNWWLSMRSMLKEIPALGDHYNISMNVGKDAGQSVKHLHFWIIPRAANKPSSNKGLASLIDAVDQFNL